MSRSWYKDCYASGSFLPIDWIPGKSCSKPRILIAILCSADCHRAASLEHNRRAPGELLKDAQAPFTILLVEASQSKAQTYGEFVSFRFKAKASGLRRPRNAPPRILGAASARRRRDAAGGAARRGTG
jgi:hypothetical protein